jgi:menaquinone-dependent protoporphyrinogen oxidase
MKILVAYASVHGSTGEVAEFIGRVLRDYNTEVTVSDVSDVQSVDGYDVFVLGSAVHGGLWLHEMSAFTDRFAQQLAQKPSYFWITCIRALEAAGSEHALKYYVDHKALQSFDVRDVVVFSGKLQTDAITRQEQWYLAANYDGKLMPGNIKHDFRDWQAIAAWANGIAKDQQLELVFEQSSRRNAAPA